MRIVAAALALMCCVAVGLPGTALAGGNEFPADGIIGLGRGGTGFTRADDPSVMLRNPALLADLWGNQAMIGGHVLAADACFQPSGGYGGPAEWIDLGGGREVPGAGDGWQTLDGEAVQPGFKDVPYPEVCFSGPIPYYPQVGLTMKLKDDLGVGLGFFPPEFANINQWGRRDGTIYSEEYDRLLPNPMRYYGTHVNTSYFSVLGAVGYRLAPGLSIGFGFKWSLLALNATTWTHSGQEREINGDVRVDLFARDLFIPAFNASVQYTPIDSVDIAVGFKWEDRIRGTAKLDLLAGPFGTGKAETLVDGDGTERPLGSRIPTLTPNVPGTLEVPPISVPQLSFGLRFADRLKPRVRDWDAARKAGGRHVEDAMSNERWDIEATAIVYFNGARDRTTFLNRGGTVRLADELGTGTKSDIESIVGTCVSPDEQKRCPDEVYETWRPHGGQTQLSLRVGGDYNVLPGIFSVRTGVSLETAGSDVRYHDPRNYDQERLGLHAGWTWRIAEVTDLSFAWAMFLHPEIRLAPHDERSYSPKYKTDEYHWVDPDASDTDGKAAAPVPSRYQTDSTSPRWVNAGVFNYDLQVFSLQLTQHF